MTHFEGTNRNEEEEQREEQDVSWEAHLVNMNVTEFEHFMDATSQLVEHEVELKLPIESDKR